MSIPPPNTPKRGSNGPLKPNQVNAQPNKLRKDRVGGGVGESLKSSPTPQSTPKGYRRWKSHTEPSRGQQSDVPVANHQVNAHPTTLPGNSKQSTPPSFNRQRQGGVDLGSSSPSTLQGSAAAPKGKRAQSTDSSSKSFNKKPGKGNALIGGSGTDNGRTLGSSEKKHSSALGSRTKPGTSTPGSRPGTTASKSSTGMQQEHAQHKSALGRDKLTGGEQPRHDLSMGDSLRSELRKEARLDKPLFGKKKRSSDDPSSANHSANRGPSKGKGIGPKGSGSGHSGGKGSSSSSSSKKSGSGVRGGGGSGSGSASMTVAVGKTAAAGTAMLLFIIMMVIVAVAGAGGGGGGGASASNQIQGAGFMVSANQYDDDIDFCVAMQNNQIKMTDEQQDAMGILVETAQDRDLTYDDIVVGVISAIMMTGFDPEYSGSSTYTVGGERPAPPPVEFDPEVIADDDYETWLEEKNLEEWEALTEEEREAWEDYEEFKEALRSYDPDEPEPEPTPTESATPTPTPTIIETVETETAHFGGLFGEEITDSLTEEDALDVEAAADRYWDRYEELQFTYIPADEDDEVTITMPDDAFDRANLPPWEVAYAMNGEVRSKTSYRNNHRYAVLLIYTWADDHSDDHVPNDELRYPWTVWTQEELDEASKANMCNEERTHDHNHGSGGGDAIEWFPGDENPDWVISRSQVGAGFGQAMAWGGHSNGRISASHLCPITGGGNLRCDAANAFNALQDAFIDDYGSPIYVTDSYRNYDTQVRLKAQKGRWAATPGTSNHGWGMALDLGSGINRYWSNQYQWMWDNAHKFGFVNPNWAKQCGSLPEPWHWEYVGVPVDPPARQCG